MKDTQCQRILAYLRKHKTATNMDLILALRIGCPHKRVAEMTDERGGVYELASDGYWRETRERILRHKIKTKGGAWVTLYSLA